MTATPSSANTAGSTSSLRPGQASTASPSTGPTSALSFTSRSAASPSRTHSREYSSELYDQNERRDLYSARHASSVVHASPSKQIKLSSNDSSNNKSSSTSTSASTPSRRKSNMNNDKAEKRRSSRACLECRLAKTKCNVTDSQDVCDRCAKFSFECRFVRHHRGRKPVSKLASIDTDDLDLGVATSRFGTSDDDMATDHDSDSANDDSVHKLHSGALKQDDEQAPDGLDVNRTASRDLDASGSGGAAAAGSESGQRKARDSVAVRSSGSRSNSKARLHRSVNTLHELDTNARRRIWEMLAQKIPQRGSTYTFVSKGEVAHDNLQASPSKSSGTKASSSGSKQVSSSSGAALASNKEEGADKKCEIEAVDQIGHAENAATTSSQTASSTSAPSQHFASTFRNLLRPVDKRAGATTAAEEAASAVSARYPRLPETLNFFGLRDPVDVGILSMAAAHRLYAYYFEHLNPWGMNFDPYFVSHDAVRTSSSFLYSTILYLASRYIELAEADNAHTEASSFYGPTFVRPRSDDDRVTAAMSAQLGSHVRSLAITAFAMGDRRMETGVAMYLSSVWKEADDHFTILYCSYAAKIMSDIPTELLSLLPSSSTSIASYSKNGTKNVNGTTAAADVHEQRLRRNQQRQFLFHFIQEHTHLLHFAPRPNFDRGPSLLRNLLAWADDELATQDDILLCADIDSVLLQTKYKSIMERAQAQEKDTLYGGSECFLLLQSFMDELEGWTSRWELQARKIEQRFRRVSDQLEREGGQTARNGEQDAREQSTNQEDKWDEKSKGDLTGHLPLDARMHLLSVMRSSLVMQISSIAFRASLRDINKAKPTAVSSQSSGGGASAAFSSSALSAMDDRAEQIYYTCLDSALNLLVHTMQMPSSILRHAQDMIMVLAPHAALLATYLVSLPLPSVPANFASSAAAASERLSYEYAKVKTRIRRRKEYERKCLELMRDTRESFRLAQVRADDHVGLCAQYFDSLLNVIEGDAQEATAATRPGRSLLSNSSVLAGTKRSRSLLDTHSSVTGEEEGAHIAHRGVVQTAASETALQRASSAGPMPSSPSHAMQQQPQPQPSSSSQTENQATRTHAPPHPRHHHARTSNMDASAAETLLNLHGTADGVGEGEAAGTTGETSTSPVAGGKMFNSGGYYGASSASHPFSRVAGPSGSTPPCSTAGATGFSPGASFISTGMFGHFAATSGGSIPNSPKHFQAHNASHQQQYAHAHHANSVAGVGAGAGAGMPTYPAHPTMSAGGGDFGFAQGHGQTSTVLPSPAPGTCKPTGTTGTGSSTPVDWTWLQSFLEVPEFSWM